MKSEELTEVIGEGDEKRVFVHPHNPERVIGIYKEGVKEFKSTPEYIHAQLYLTKILHLLFPDNIPDIFEVTSQPKTITRKRILLGELHRGLSQKEDIPKRESSREEMRRAIDTDPKAQTFLKEIESLGIVLDKATKNFTFDTDNNIVYLDDIRPWNQDGDKWYDANALKEYIEKNLKGERRKNAENYLKHFLTV